MLLSKCAIIFYMIGREVPQSFQPLKNISKLIIVGAVKYQQIIFVCNIDNAHTKLRRPLKGIIILFRCSAYNIAHPITVDDVSTQVNTKSQK